MPGAPPPLFSSSSSNKGTKKMAKLFIALCLLPCLLGAALAVDTFVIEGRVYCDTCRAGFETGATEYIGEAKVRIECKNFTTNQITKKVDGTANSQGTYNIQVEGVHEEEICEAVLVSSPRADCKEVKEGRDRARILLTHDSGISSNVRYANSLGFLIDTPLPVCGQLLQMYALADDLD